MGPSTPSRLPADAALGPVRLRVADGARAAAWLHRVLGLAPLASAVGRTRHGTAGGRPLVELREVPRLRRVPPRGLLGLYHYAILLPARADLGRFVAHLEAIGEPYGSSDHLFSEAIYLTDPDGLTVEVYADRPRSAWIRRNGDIVGTLDPLDRDSVLRAAGETRWDRMPAGAIMGHLHFYISDLALAARFYLDLLGFEISTRVFPGALFVAAGGYHHHVGLNVWAAHEPIATAADAGLDDWSLLLPPGEALGELRARAGAVRVPLEPDGDALVAKDPWGITVRVQFPPDSRA